MSDMATKVTIRMKWWFVPIIIMIGYLYKLIRKEPSEELIEKLTTKGCYLEYK